MSFIACLNRLFGKGSTENKAIADRAQRYSDRPCAPGNQRAGVTICEDGFTAPRKYKVPDGLKDRVLELQDKAEIAGSRHRAHEALWFLLSERCPETRNGNWKVITSGPDVFVVEVLA